MKKRGQIYGVVLMVFIVAIVLTLIFYFGIKGMGRVYGKKCQSDLVLLEKELGSSFDYISTQAGSIDKEEYKVPCKIERVYFIDLNEEIDEDIKNESRLIYDSLVSGVEKNVFFMRGGEILDSIYLPDLKLRYPYYRCFDARKRARMEFYLEGYGGGTDIQHVDHWFNCGYIPVLMENDSLNEYVLGGGDTDDPAVASDAILGVGTLTPIDKNTAKQRIENTKEDAYLGRKVDIKKEGTNIKIRIKMFGGKTANDFTYVESIPKECFEFLTDYLNLPELFLAFPPPNYNLFPINDPIIVWHFNQPITDKEEIEYELEKEVDCMRIINALGFGEIS